MLMYFVAHCDKNLHLSYSTIKLYLSGKQFFLLEDEMIQSFRKQVMSTFTMFVNNIKWCKKTKQVSTRVKSARLPITSYIRCKICHLLHTGIFDIFTSSLLEAAFSVASLDLYDVESLRF